MGTCSPIIAYILDRSDQYFFSLTTIVYFMELVILHIYQFEGAMIASPISFQRRFFGKDGSTFAVINFFQKLQTHHIPYIMILYYYFDLSFF